jgi:hypothetical protein
MPAMKVVLLAVFLSTPLLQGALAQTRSSPSSQTPYEIKIARELAEKLLIHKADPVCKPIPMGSRVTGTVVVDI